MHGYTWLHGCKFAWIQGCMVAGFRILNFVFCQLSTCSIIRCNNISVSFTLTPSSLPLLMAFSASFSALRISSFVLRVTPNAATLQTKWNNGRISGIVEKKRQKTKDKNQKSKVIKEIIYLLFGFLLISIIFAAKFNKLSDIFLIFLNIT